MPDVRDPQRQRENDATGQAGTVQVPNLRDLINEEEFTTDWQPLDDADVKRAKEAYKTLIDSFSDPDAKIDADTERTIDAQIKAIEQLLSEQLSEIMHHPKFQEIEASWRGLHDLVMKSREREDLQIHVLNVSRQDLLNDMSTNEDVKRSPLWDKVYKKRYDTWGANPVGTLLGDYYFTPLDQDIRLLDRMSQLAAAGHTPFIASIDPKMLGMKEDFTALDQVNGDPAELVSGATHIAWNRFRAKADARYAALTLPRVLARLPWGEDNPYGPFNFQEDVGNAHNKYLWQNAAYRYGLCLTRAFAKTGWFAQISGPAGGGLVEDLPVPLVMTPAGPQEKSPTEVTFDSTLENNLSKLGFLPVSYKKDGGIAAFFGSQSCYQPQPYTDPEHTANDRLSAMLSSMLCTSRFAHYLKQMMLGIVGKGMEEDEIREFLTKWLANYTLANPKGQGDDVKAQRPLQSFTVEVKPVDDDPGAYIATVMVRPHFLLKEVTVHLRLTARKQVGA
jgi:type VI secretion system protein ImpC